MADDFDFDLGDGDFLNQGLPGLDPAPDEDAWEAFLTLALERMQGVPDNGLSNAQLAEIEAALGAQLPFEIGLLLVMGVPDDDAWRVWESPTDDIAAWNASLLHMLHRRVEDEDLWLESWGPKPANAKSRVDAATEAFTLAPPLFPLYGSDCVAVAVADGETASESNPIWSVLDGRVAVQGTDLAAWLHHGWQVPLPMWPETAERTFPLWSELRT